MATVRPIMDISIIEKMKTYLRERSFRDYLIFKVGINLGLSVQDLFMLRVEDLLGKKEFIYGNHKIVISELLQKEICQYVGDRTTGCLFITSYGNPISRFQFYGVLKNVANIVGFDEPIGTISLRKTFAYWAYREQKIHLPVLSKYLNHHTVQHTLRYICVEETDYEGAALASIDL